jgi:membrane associated rhomboid family serine protease
MFGRKKIHHYFFEKFLVVLGVVLIWRGIWYALDLFDKYFFGQSHWVTALGGVMIGFLLLYLPDKNLEEI